MTGYSDPGGGTGPPPDDGAFMLHGFPRAILHVDGDAFFTSVEQALHPDLKGRPVVTGKERGIIACASYEAKALGIKRGVALWEARKKCPDLVVLPSDYESYSLFSKRMFAILRRYTPVVEEYSIDEGFADLTGLRRVFHCSYREMAARIQADVARELDITVSAGLSLSKSLAKLGSKFRKPRGITAVAGRYIHLFLREIPLARVWGFGPNTVSLLEKYGLRTALDFARQPEPWARRLLGKVGSEIWRELRGEAVLPVVTQEKTSYASIGKGKTFTAPSQDRDYIYAGLVRNLESAFIKLRRHQLRCGEISVALRHKDYREDGLTARLTRATAATAEVTPLARELFARLFKPAAWYRSTQVVLTRLEEDGGRQMELFTDEVRIDRWWTVTRTMDALNRQLGKHKVCLGPALFLQHHPLTARDEKPWRRQALLPGETTRQRLGLPRLDITV